MLWNEHAYRQHERVCCFPIKYHYDFPIVWELHIIHSTDSQADQQFSSAKIFFSRALFSTLSGVDFSRLELKMPLIALGLWGMYERTSHVASSVTSTWKFTDDVNDIEIALRLARKCADVSKMCELSSIQTPSNSHSGENVLRNLPSWKSLMMMKSSLARNLQEKFFAFSWIFMSENLRGSGPIIVSLSRS